MKIKLNLQNYIGKLTYLMLFLAGVWVNAQPTPPTAPPEGGVGAVGPGAPATPIDIYVLILSVIAVLMIFGYHFYTRRIRTQGI
ncbi:hypothetical protein J5295_00580 [Riemerella anatipestifer]|nr:hypothetical protein [Riemerella anatipestifer]ADQ81752.1 hypothetical protein Riean_0585 [Riemerella anatipestifer ATCC 11845 = DSM 15868]ADZ12751.1 hypothetical protein RIA_1669 [Riemerella anatipestifer RA-GD]EFT36741.1 hypothetical protein RAYM_06937 [Riemerella anatipestifer RA-YM]MBF2798942.1 hypothetical protein [Riemerella anatipestifer]MBT0525294.1 hypothetical protein [Riemerella anatipestifer]